MAKDLTGRVWILDSAESITTNPVRIRKMTYYPNAADDDLVIRDKGAKLIWKVRAAAGAPNYESYGRIDFDCPREGLTFNGMTVATITTGGEVHVYVA